MNSHWGNLNCMNIVEAIDGDDKKGSLSHLSSVNSDFEVCCDYFGGLSPDIDFLFFPCCSTK